jgi:hypothetical protein
MSASGWKQLVEGWPWFRGEGSYPIHPNSEYMPPVRLVRKPYGAYDPIPLAEDDPWGWPIPEYEEALALRPGLCTIASAVLGHLTRLCRGETEGDELFKYKLRDNPYWPKELATHAQCLEHERLVLLLPLALSLTQDDKAHTPWTLFGGSEQGPARAFWKSFFTAPDHEVPERQVLDFFHTLLSSAYGESVAAMKDLQSLGLRILPLAPGSSWTEGPLPSWTTSLLWGEEDSTRDLRYLLTFRPFAELPRRIRSRYLDGKLHLLPFPGSLLFWGIPAYLRMREQIPFAVQIPLLHFVERHLGIRHIRIPQAGWFQETGPAAPSKPPVRGPFRETYKRTYRTARVHRHADELVTAAEHRLPHVLFSTRPHDIDLYHKPMARNIQLWDHDFRVLLDGPRAEIEEIRRAAEAVEQGGVFGYRFLFPPFQIGRHELYWHRPLVAHRHHGTGKSVVLSGALTGYLTAYPEDTTTLADPIELWPRLLHRDLDAANVALFHGLEETPPLRTLNNVRKVLHVAGMWSPAKVPRPFARSLLTVEKDRTLEGWLRSLSRSTTHTEEARRLADGIEGLLESSSAAEPLPAALTFGDTAGRSFEEDCWNTIALMSSGEYRNKNNADCVLDPPTQAVLRHHERDLDALGSYLLNYYEKLVASKRMKESVLVGELPFRWQTQYSFPWMGGWVKNQEGEAYERNLLVVIPGRDRSRAVIMADHYDTAYMYDHYEKRWGGNGARLSAPGADDNCSATAALMLGARSFLELSRQGRLGCDVWLVHLTGEEYPAEGLGACRLCEWLVEGTLKLRTTAGATHDLSNVQVKGLYVLDMIAHNNNKDRQVFQIAPGVSRESLWLAYQAHLANRIWNASAEVWNRAPARRDAGPGRRTRSPRVIPPIARFPSLNGEVRLSFDARSTLFNTDGQAFSDVGVPVVLFMENYDIDRVGYHDSHDNMTLINLDYGAALAAITIESVARAATVDA